MIKWQTVSMALMVVSSIDAAWQPSSVDPPSHIPAKAATLLQNSIPSLQALSHTTSINSLNKTCHLSLFRQTFISLRKHNLQQHVFPLVVIFSYVFLFSILWMLEIKFSSPFFLWIVYTSSNCPKIKQYDDEI